MKTLFKVYGIGISICCMIYGFYQLYQDAFVRPYIVFGYVGEWPFPDHMVSFTFAWGGTLALMAILIYGFWERVNMAWKEEKCPHCGKKIHVGAMTNEWKRRTN